MSRISAAASLAALGVACLALAVSFATGCPEHRDTRDDTARRSDASTGNAELAERVRALEDRVAALTPSMPPLPTPTTPTRTERRHDPTPILPTPPGVADLLPADASPARVQEGRALAERIRREAEARLAGAASEAARVVSESMRREKELLEDAARGGAMTLLRAVADDGGRPLDFVSSPESFATLFARHVEGPERVESAWRQREPLEDGATVVLAAGVHEWDVGAYQHRDSFPKDVLVRGAGMDATLLRLNELKTRHTVRSLTFEDLTIDASDDYLTDLRNDSPITLRLVRCRVVGFDMGAGGSVMLAARTAALYASDCRFEAGYGRTAPQHGNLFRVSSGLLVRVERSVFNGPFRSVYESAGKATYVFDGCTFENMPERSRPGFEHSPAGVLFQDCSFAYAEDGTRWERRRLRDINREW